MNKKVRVRFAPSPTGPLHIGGVRTALFNYLFAKKHKGTFVLRIEDTDQNRYVAGAEKYIVEALNWCNIPFDEGPDKNEKFGPYRQSERKQLYKKYADELIEKGCAYYAFDTSEALNFHRKDHEAKGKTFIYNHHNRLKLDNSLALSADVISEKLKSGTPYVVRFKTPTDEQLELNDIIRGKMIIDTNVLDDKILFKSDGMPTYHLANIVDDYLMEISHVIRGEEWLPSMALHVLLYRAFGWNTPNFAHLPLILKPTGKGKLSKRDGDKMGFPVFPLEWTDPKTNDVSSGYKEMGYFNDALVNMLALLGWNAGTEQEIFSLDELVTQFDLNRVSKSGAKFDPEKTKWFQHQYIQKQSDEALANLFLPILKEHIIASVTKSQGDIAYITKVISLTKERATFVSDFWGLTSFFFIAPKSFDAKAVKKQWKETTPNLMCELITVIKNVSDFSSENLESSIKEWITKKELGFGRVMQPFRLSLVGALKGPHLFDIATLLGREETVKRIQYAIDTVKKE
ncbi:MAG: glutamate--tRNA ligase [Flavobacteriaceae bacterium]|nr:glutamate--tRNA ligase [Flavobacteriaceae bacterium]